MPGFPANSENEIGCQSSLHFVNTVKLALSRFLGVTNAFASKPGSGDETAVRSVCEFGLKLFEAGVCITCGTGVEINLNL